MANWTVSLDKPVSVEPPNAVAYVTYTSDDAPPRTIAGVRVPYAAESDLLDFLARECLRLAALDDRNAAMAGVVKSATIVPGPIALPDISAKQALADAQRALQLQVNAALQQKALNDALSIDPTIADTQTAVASAEASVASVQSAQSAKAASP